jgi:hypothetical protein
MDEPLTNADYEKLLFVEAALRVQKYKRFSEKDVSLLQVKGLLVKFGMSVEITPKGIQALSDLRQGS